MSKYERYSLIGSKTPTDKNWARNFPQISCQKNALFTQLSLKDNSFKTLNSNFSNLLEVANLLQKLNPLLGTDGPGFTGHVATNWPDVLNAISCIFLTAILLQQSFWMYSWL